MPKNKQKRNKKIERALSKIKDLSERKEEEVKEHLLVNYDFLYTNEYRDIIKNLFSNKNQLSVEYWLERGWGDESESKALWRRAERYEYINKYDYYIEYILNSYKLITEEKIIEMKIFMLQNHPIPLPFKKIKKIITKELFKSMGRINTYQYEYYMCLGYSEKEAKRIISDRQKLNSEKLSIKRSKNPENYEDVLPTQKEYWIKLGFSNEEAIENVRKRQSTFSKEKCITKYGYEEGMRKWEERQSKWLNTLQKKPNIDEINKSKGRTYEQLKSQYGIEKANSIIASKLPSFDWGRASKESLKYFIPLYQWLRRRGYKRTEIFLGVDGSGEKMIRSQDKTYFFDFTIVNINVIIEFNGVAFHPKSRKQKDWKSIFGGSVDEIYDNNRRKIQCAKDTGYAVLEVWSDECLILDKMKMFIIEKEKNDGKDIIEDR